MVLKQKVHFTNMGVCVYGYTQDIPGLGKQQSILSLSRKNVSWQFGVFQMYVCLFVCYLGV